MKYGMKVAAVASALALSLFSMPLAFADAVQGGQIIGVSSSSIKMTTVTANSASISGFQPGSMILGFKLYANDASDSCGLYDVETVIATSSSNLIDEWTEATDEETNIQMWPMPYRLTTALTVLTNGVCVVYWQ